MRVLLAAHAFLPRSTAGVEVYTDRLARGLRGEGHDVVVLTAVHDLAAAPYDVRRRRLDGLDVVEVVNVHQHGTLEATWRDPRMADVLGALVGEMRPDVVHLQHLLNLSAELPALCRRAGAAVVLTLHDHWLSCPRDGLRMRADLTICETVDHAVCAACLADSPYLVPPVQRGAGAVARRLGLGRHLHGLHAAAPRVVEGVLAGLRRLQPPGADGLPAALDARRDGLRCALDDVDLVLAPTRFVRDLAVAWGVPAARVQVMALGAVEASTPRPAGPRRRLAYVGTIAPHKGLHVLVDAVRQVGEPALTLDVHGSPTVAPSYAAAVQEAASGDRRIRFRGGFAEGGQTRVLDGCDALVVPSVWWENSPLTVLEAAAAGKVVVASDVGGVREILPEGAGVLVPPGDATALADVLGRLARGELLAESAPAVAIKTVRQGARELGELYRRLVSRDVVAHA